MTISESVCVFNVGFMHVSTRIPKYTEIIVVINLKILFIIAMNIYIEVILNIYIEVILYYKLT